MTHMKKNILKVGVGLLILLVVFLVVLGLSLDSLVKRGVETVGPKIAKVEVKLQGASMSPFSGKGEIKGLVIGNPEGYKTPSAISVGSAHLSLLPASLLSDKIVVRSIRVEAPEITFEGSLSGNNLSKLLENVEATTSSATSKPETADQKTQRKIQVDDFLITGGRINLSVTMLGSKSATVPLPDIHLTGLGAGPEGITVAEFSRKVLQAILKDTLVAVGGAMGQLGTGALESGKNLGKGALDNAGKATKGIGDLFKKK